MTSLIESVRGVIRDLIDKRLWPVALALLAAVVVVPMLVGASSPEVAAPAPATHAAAAPQPAAAVPDDAGDADRAEPASRSGKVRDPFYDPPKPADEAGATTAKSAGGATRAVADPPAAAGGGAGAGASASAKAPATASAPKATRTPPTAVAPDRPSRSPAPAARTSRYYRAVVGWGPKDAESHAIARLTPLGGRRNPAALYLGIAKADALYAIFVLGPNATSSGDGACRTGTDCRMVALKAGETRRFVVRSTTGGPARRYTLRVRSVRAIRTGADAARRGRARVHRAGRSVLRAMWRSPVEAAVLRRASYHRRTGLLRAPAPDAVKSAAE